MLREIYPQLVVSSIYIVVYDVIVPRSLYGLFFHSAKVTIIVFDEMWENVITLQDI
jgi:hypothetical protein